MTEWIYTHFNMTHYNTTIKKELLAALTSFFTVSYIVIVNASILRDAGISTEASVVATTLTCFLGCLIIGFWANSPLVIIPGMGENIFFSYTIVQSLGLNWQEALGVVLVSGIIFTLITFTPFSRLLINSIPHSLKNAITVGIGLFLTFIGLQKGGLITDSSVTIIGLDNLFKANTLLTIFTLALAVILFIYNIRGGFLIVIGISTLVAALCGITKLDPSYNMGSLYEHYPAVFNAFSFTQVKNASFWTATFSLTMILLFQNLGTIQSFENDNKRFNRAYQATGMSNIFAGVFGTSSTVAGLESAVGIAAGAKTGLSSIFVGLLFLISFFFMPFIKMIPDGAVAPILIIIGSLMLKSIKEIDFDDFSEYFPAFLTIIMIPLTYNIADGIAFGFIFYPVIKLLTGKRKELNKTICVIGLLFLLNYILSY
ncbi:MULTISPECIES: NCS2 family permease [Bacillus]|uniref:Permease n=1 Tax=Bacillus thuringiensis subsp. medellin TaxID=79672 RepID=A0A9X6REB9_BACTV|nr:MULTISPECIES: NCS2 family permease [Bacillus]MDM5375053.1 NCS2 family permease [Bacillus bombysepticus]ASI82899.1 Guanine-hypoxanthine permease [Bacillus cereus]EEK89881.1 Xanthine/uracil permease [Bacillus cereus m1550]MBR9673009.1 NCS2 family permease [Bacillus cereus]MDF9542096.1 NCS2 family permease [Bacillus cereus]